MAKNNDSRYMKIAVCLAKKGLNKVYPNPMVGCVIVNKGRIVGRGHHKQFGGKHAEINALETAGRKALGSTMYVTLEPCSCWGKTPPCTKSITKAGIEKVVIGSIDTNPKNKKMGLEYMKKHGIAVKTGVLSEITDKINPEYNKIFKNRKSRVIVKAAMSIDGKIASRTGDSKWITSKKAREYVHQLRGQFDAIVVGINTVLKDNPGLTSHGKGSSPVKVVIDPGLKIPIKSKIVTNKGYTVIFHSNAKNVSKINQLLKMRVSLVRAQTNTGMISFKFIKEKLFSMGLNKIFVEGGGETIARVLEEEAADEIVFFIAPKIIGGRQAKTSVEGIGIKKISQAINLADLKVKKIGKDFVFRGKIKR
ncbi:bifunctional diaminohydroxyphosphoribosylaminopyrimidine deaminase/5-amino-6-(5-phosphoribosylamino)uracil reductase RibD [Elusimicrobiota bacterium]